MATSGDGTAPYETTGAGGKFRKRPLRRSIPYARPVRNNNPSVLQKLVNPASRLIYAGANKLFDLFGKNLPSPSLPPPENDEEPQNVLHEEGGIGNSAATGISDLELLLQQKTFTRSEIERLTSVLHSKTTESPSDDSPETHGYKRDDFHAAISTPIVSSRAIEDESASPAELAKHYMGSRPSSQAPRQDLKLLPRTPITPVAQNAANSLRNLENGFVTPRSRGRSAMYAMARRPYSSSTFSQQGVKSEYGHVAALTSSQGREGKTALKRRSSVLDDDIGSGGPLRRIRQKANLLSQRDRKELGYPVFQQSDGAGQTLLLTNGPEPNVSNYASVPTNSTQTANKILQQIDKKSVEKSSNKLRLDMLHGQALRSLEKVDSPKLLTSSHDSQIPVVSELTSQSKDKTEENGARNITQPHNMLTSVNGDMTMTDTLKDKAPTVEITDLPSKVTEEPQKKHAFQMSAPDDFFDMDDDDDDVCDNGHVTLPLVENNKPETSAELVEFSKPETSPEASKASKQVELKEVENDVSAPKTDFKIPVSSPSVTTIQTSEFTQSALQMEKVSPLKVSPVPFSANGLSGFKPNVGSETKEIESISVFHSVTKNDHVKISASNNDENGSQNGNDQKATNMFGKSESLSTPGMFSFGTSTENLSTSNTSPASNPPTFPSLAPFSASASTATISAISATSSPVIFSTSVPPQVFSFGSATSTAPTTSVAETGTPFAITTFATTTTTTPTGSGLFGFSSPAAAASNATTASGLFGVSSSAAATSPTTPTPGSGLFGFSAPSAATSTTTTTTTGSGLFGFSSPAAASSSATTGSGLFGVSSPAAATSTTSGSGLFGFSAPAAATSTTTTTTPGNGLFGFSASAATTSTTTTTTPAAGNGLFGFSASAAATSTTTTTAAAAGNGLFGFSAPAAAASTTTTTTGNGLFGFSSPAAATTTATTGSGLFGFSSPAAASSTATTGSTLFGFSSPAAAVATSTVTTGSGLFGFSSPATATTSTTTTANTLFGFGSSTATTSTTTSQSNGSFFNATNGFKASTNASSPSTLFGSSAPAFGINATGPASETKPTTSIFGSTWQQPQNPSAFTFGASSTPAPSFATAGASNSSFGGPSVFGSSTPVFGNNNISKNSNGNSDQMSMEDSMAEDSMQTHSPVSPFGQAPVSAPGFVFGAPTTPTPGSFSFGGQQTQAPPPHNPFQSSSVEFNGGGGSFSLGSGGDKSNRRMVRVTKSKNRKK